MRPDEPPKVRARALRRVQTPAEQVLWFALRAKRFEGIKFSRQVSIGPFIVDFAARSRKVVVEVDGDSHARAVEYDARRTAYLEQQGYRLVRFSNAEVLGNMEGVLHSLGVALAEGDPPLPTLSPEGRGL